MRTPGDQECFEPEEVDAGELESLSGRTILHAYIGEGGFHIDLDDDHTIIVLLGALVRRSNATLQ